MHVIDDLTKINLGQETILTIGAFDGVHRGHQALIGAVRDRASATGRLAALVTFHPHPAVLLAPDRAPRYLTTLGSKLALFESLGVDLVVLLTFDLQMAATPARQFMEKLSGHLQFRELWVGADFALGRNREGDVHYLRELGQDLGYEVRVFEPVLEVHGTISSSRIRALLSDGCVEKAAALLGRYPSLSGEVIVGAHRGRILGFPTANLKVHPERAIPADGVYAVFAVLGTARHPAVANIGVRPSFDNGHRTVETHIFDFDQDIYGCDLVVEFVARLRDERRFENIDDLVSQIERDSKAARRILTDELGKVGDVEAACSARCYRYREVDHTADRALQVWGKELPDLFIGAARGMYNLMAELNGLVATHWRTIELKAWDRETLLVDWLNELLFLTEMEGLLVVEFRIESLSDSPGPVSNSGKALTEIRSAHSVDVDSLNQPEARLVAQVGAVHAPVTGAVIKAATFHDLSLLRDESGWSTVVTLDV
ncbi:MAG TPA: bifunctional riboflavin kinase/FAD synthetase [Anaerolineae bacterium]|nr:bifunctional riboflavin kinase/FAD synthetase [Anaerolineae bacterium]